MYYISRAPLNISFGLTLIGYKWMAWLGFVDENKSNRGLLVCIPMKIAYLWVFVGQIDVSWQMFLGKAELYNLRFTYQFYGNSTY